MDTAQAWFYWIGTALSGLAMAYALAAWLASRARRIPWQSVPATLPPVTILKPLCGAERELYACLRSFCDQSYPRFQIVFGVRDADDPALTVVRRLQREFPGRDLQLAINSRQHGSSGKVSNLINMMPLARYDYLVIADSDVRVAPDYLARVVPPLLDSEVGIVTCPYRGCPGRGTWSLLESAFINDWFMPSVYVAALLGSRAFAFGATIGLRREVLARSGGFISIANQLADDYRLGELTRRMGLRTVLSEVVVGTVVDECSLDDLVRHELRWLRTIRAVRPLGYACCFFTFGLAPAALGTLLAVGAWPSLAMLTVTAVARLLIHCSARGARSTLLQFWVVPLTDLLNFTLWCRGFLARRVQWRHARYRIARDGSAHAIP
ncbi:MAG TPA: bacteriohopanetetrol glucosamine biosynthesis glycosyltransferase HpnI [Steroidobacteraceae bacterium]|nr:bacteriohopanetetrol glucosamine biosynthesis glycosyltransferase HpnI [Steroidobacteraceae bacterium]